MSGAHLFAALGSSPCFFGSMMVWSFGFRNNSDTVKITGISVISVPYFLVQVIGSETMGELRE